MVFYNSKLAKLLKVNGITLYPFIFIASPENDTQIQKDLILHEHLHLEQYKQYWIIGFIAIYLYDYIKGRLSGLTHYKAYMEVRFEKDAYFLVRTGRQRYRHGDTTC